MTPKVRELNGVTSREFSLAMSRTGPVSAPKLLSCSISTFGTHRFARATRNSGNVISNNVPIENLGWANIGAVNLSASFVKLMCFRTSRKLSFSIRTLIIVQCVSKCPNRTQVLTNILISNGLRSTSVNVLTLNRSRTLFNKFVVIFGGTR